MTNFGKIEFESLNAEECGRICTVRRQAEVQTQTWTLIDLVQLLQRSASEEAIRAFACFLDTFMMAFLCREASDDVTSA